MIHPYFKLQWALLVAHDELIRELDIECKFALGDDFRGDIDIPRALIATLEVLQITEQPPHEDVILLIGFHQAVESA